MVNDVTETSGGESQNTHFAILADRLCRLHRHIASWLESKSRIHQQRTPDLVLAFAKMFQSQLYQPPEIAHNFKARDNLLQHHVSRLPSRRLYISKRDHHRHRGQQLYSHSKLKQDDPIKSRIAMMRTKTRRCSMATILLCCQLLSSSLLLEMHISSGLTTLLSRPSDAGLRRVIQLISHRVQHLSVQEFRHLNHLDQRHCTCTTNCSQHKDQQYRNQPRCTDPPFYVLQWSHSKKANHYPRPSRLTDEDINSCLAAWQQRCNSGSSRQAKPLCRVAGVKDI